MDRPVNFLFVGLVHPHKGCASLLKAFEHIPVKDGSLTLVGRLEVPARTFRRYSDRVNYVGSVPRSEVVKYFVDADCFIFPSLFEGSALVLHEAAAAGLGIIQSAYSGDGVRGGRNGEILDEVDSARLVSAVRSIIADPERLTAWQEASWAMREERSWKRYREHIRDLIST